jgi:hypothetical protein
MVEATSSDGIVEGIRPTTGERVLAVQWHPEWRSAENTNSRQLFAWFGMLIRGASLKEAADHVAVGLSKRGPQGELCRGSSAGLRHYVLAINIAF